MLIVKGILIGHSLILMGAYTLMSLIIGGINYLCYAPNVTTIGGMKKNETRKRSD